MKVNNDAVSLRNNHSTPLSCSAHSFCSLKYDSKFAKESFFLQRYVQDLLREDHSIICDLLLHSKAHLYVCGSAAMAEDVKKTLQVLI